MLVSNETATTVARIVASSSTLHTPQGASVFSPIALQEFDAQKYREFVLRWLSGDGKIVSTTPSAFAEQLRICREEYRRRHPK
jgi:hypothetical protein